jgi:hypothetical protein
MQAKYLDPDITIRPSDNFRPTVRRRPPEVLLQLARGEGIDVDVPWLPSIERDPMAFDRPTAPAPFWVESVRAELEPEPRQTTPSIVKFAGDVRNGRRRIVATAFAAMMVLSGFAIARVFATDVVVAE